MGVAFSPDGSHLATGYLDHPPEAKIWDIKTGEEVFSLKGHNDWLMSIAYSPAGSHIATSSGDDTAIVWDALTGKKLFS